MISPEDFRDPYHTPSWDAESTKDESHAVSVTVPTNTTSKRAIHATETALEGREGAMTAKHKDTRTEAQRARFRQIALENVAGWARPGEDTPPGLPIRTEYDTRSISPPRRVLSEKARKRLKENMISPEDMMRDPYHVPSCSQPLSPKDSSRG